MGRRSAATYNAGASMTVRAGIGGVGVPPTPHMRACLGCCRTVSSYSLESGDPSVRRLAF